MKKRILLFAIILSLLSNITALASTKDEVVYVNLDSSGEKTQIITVNTFKTNGKEKIIDYGNYDNIKNLTNTEKPQKTDGKLIFDSKGSKEFSYQGTLKKGELPWNFKISYRLNNKPIKGEDLVGKSGKCEIKLDVISNPKSNEYYRNNYLTQITMVLDTEKCKNIECDGAIGADVGSNRQLTFAVLPNRTKNYSIKFDADKFEMDGLTIAMIKLSDGILGNTIDNASITVSGVTSGISQLLDGSGQLKNGADDLVRGLALVNSGSQSIKTSFPTLLDGMNTLSSSSAQLSNGLQTLSFGSAKIRSGLFELDSKSNDISNGISTISDGLKKISDNKSQVENGLSSLKKKKSDVKKLSESGTKLVDGYEKVYDGISTIASKNSDISKGLDELHKNSPDISALSKGLKTLGDGVDEIYSATNKGNNSAAATLYSSSQQVYSSASAQLPTLKKNLEELQKQYNINPNESIAAQISLLEQLITQVTILQNISGGTVTYIDTVKGALSQLKGGINELSVGVETVQNGMNKLYDTADKFGNAALVMSSGAVELKSGMNDLNSGLKTYTNGAGNVMTLYDSAEKFGNSALQMVNGAKKLYDGSKTLSNGFSQYANGVGDLASGYIAVDNGIDTAAQGSSELASGANLISSSGAQMDSIISELGDGINTLTTSSSALPEGANSLTSGTKQLFDGVSAVDISAMISKGATETAVSFAAPNVAKPEKVQFIIKTPNLHMSEKEKIVEEESKKGFFQKLLDLFA